MVYYTMMVKRYICLYLCFSWICAFDFHDDLIPVKYNGEMLEIPCSKNYCDGQSIHVCKDTGLVRVKDLRNALEIANSWSVDVYSDDWTADGPTNAYTARVPAVKARQTYVADFADVNIGLKDKVLCDIGAGEGQFLEIITSDDYKAKAFGIEPSEKNCISLSENNFKNFKGTIEDWEKSDQFEENKFDIIVDLNPTFQLAISRFISLLNSEMKVGFVSDFSDRFYNIQLDISKSGIMEKGFKQINWILAQ